MSPSEAYRYTIDTYTAVGRDQDRMVIALASAAIMATVGFVQSASFVGPWVRILLLIPGLAAIASLFVTMHTIEEGKALLMDISGAIGDQLSPEDGAARNAEFQRRGRLIEKKAKVARALLFAAILSLAALVLIPPAISGARELLCQKETQMTKQRPDAPYSTTQKPPTKKKSWGRIADRVPISPAQQGNQGAQGGSGSSNNEGGGKK